MAVSITKVMGHSSLRRITGPEEYMQEEAGGINEYAVWTKWDKAANKTKVLKVELFNPRKAGHMTSDGIVRGKDEMDVYKFIMEQDKSDHKIADKLGLTTHDMKAILAVGEQK